MKKKYLAIVLGIAMTAAMLSGCGSGTGTSTSASASSESAASADQTEQTISGKITAIDGSTITLDDEQSFEITDDTTISRQMGDMGGGGQDGEAPEMPNGENSDGGGGQDGEAPEMPNGENSGESNDQNGEPPAKPDGDTVDTSASGTGSSDSSDQAEPPEKPDGENADGSTADSGSTPPEMPSGEAPSGSGEAPSGDAPSGQTPPSGNGQDESFDPNAELTVDDLQVGDEIEVVFDDDGNAVSVTIKGGEMGAMGGGQSTGVDSYDAVTEYTEDTEVSGETYESTGTDENAIHVSNGATVKLDEIKVTRNSEDSTGGDNSSFYGVGAAILNTDGTTTVSNADISTDANGAAGVFSYGDGITYVSDSSITTEGDTSGGIHVSGGGTLYADNLTVETSGASSAAIRSDRGGGTMVVDGGSYTSNGSGSPAVYCTADIDVSNADLTANGSEAVCIEGFNSLSLTDCNLTGNMKDDEQNDCTWNVILYQSMSGDSEVGNSTFEMNGGTLTAKNGGMFYTTNTESTFTLENVAITYADDSEYFLRCTGNSNERGWGTAGSNGAECTFTGINQQMEGDVIWDSISQLDFNITKGSTLTGAVTDDESDAGNGGDGFCNITIDQNSTWVVTGDSTLTKLTNAGTIQDTDGKTVTVKGTDGTVYVKGDSAYTITVESYEG